MDINAITVVGRLTKDPELNKTQSGKSVCTFTLAVSRKSQDSATDFIQCVAWEQSAEYISRYGHKGQTCGVVGRLQSRSYEDRDGNKRQITEVSAKYVDLINDGGRQEKQNEGRDVKTPEFDTGNVNVINPEDLPF